MINSHLLANFKAGEAILRDPLTENHVIDPEGPRPTYPLTSEWYECALMLSAKPINSDDDVLVVDGNQRELEYQKDFFISDTYVCFRTTPTFPVEVAWNPEPQLPLWNATGLYQYQYNPYMQQTVWTHPYQSGQIYGPGSYPTVTPSYVPSNPYGTSYQFPAYAGDVVLTTPTVPLDYYFNNTFTATTTFTTNTVGYSQVINISGS